MYFFVSLQRQNFFLIALVTRSQMVVPSKIHYNVNINNINYTNSFTFTQILCKATIFFFEIFKLYSFKAIIFIAISFRCVMINRIQKQCIYLSSYLLRKKYLSKISVSTNSAQPHPNRMSAAAKYDSKNSLSTRFTIYSIHNNQEKKRNKNKFSTKNFCVYSKTS